MNDSNNSSNPNNESKSNIRSVSDKPIEGSINHDREQERHIHNLAPQGQLSSDNANGNGHGNGSKSSNTQRRLSDRNRTSTSEKDIMDMCPRINCPEKIVICIDLSYEMEKITFRSRAGDKFSSLKLVKRALGLYLQTKHQLDRRHEFALVVLHDKALWVMDLTDDPNEVIRFLDELNVTHQCETFMLESIFDVVCKKVLLPEVEEPAIMPPPYVVRILLLYGRSYCVPTLQKSEAQIQLQKSPHFFLDAYYIHEPPSAENKCEDVFDLLCELDETGKSYVFEVSKNPTKLYDCMAMLLAHPLQRPIQNDTSYRLESTVETQQKTTTQT